MNGEATVIDLAVFEPSILSADPTKLGTGLNRLLGIDLSLQRILHSRAPWVRRAPEPVSFL